MTSEKKREKKTLSMKMNNIKDDFQLSVLAFPAFILTLIFCYIPMVGVIIAFKDYNPRIGIMASEWIGLDNFEFYFSSNDFTRTMRNTLLYSTAFLVLGNIVNLTFAIFMYNVKSRMALKYYQTTAILPHFLSMVLVAYIVYGLLSPEGGILNTVLSFFGQKEPIQWYQDAKYWPFILTIVNFWKGVGMGSIIYYAALMGIDETLFEAAKIDGANKWQQIIKIMVPMLSSIICIQLILGIGSLVGGDFGLFYQVTMNKGVLYPTTDIISTYTYRALSEATGSLGRTAAVGLFQSVAGFILVVGSNLIVKKLSPENSLF